MMNTGRTIAMLFAAALFAAGTGCSDSNKDKPVDPAKDKTAQPKFAPDKQWTTEEMAKDPAGYMSWADAKISKQVDDRTDRLKKVNAKLADIESRQRTLRDNIADMVNISSRMDMAVRRAEDEDRWPVQMAGRKFDRDEALAVITQARKYVSDRRSLVFAYDTAVDRARAMAGVLNKEIGDLKELREKMALQLEAIKINEGLEDLAELRRTEEEIAGFAKALSDMTEESLTENLPETAKDNERVDMDAFLKKNGG